MKRMIKNLFLSKSRFDKNKLKKYETTWSDFCLVYSDANLENMYSYVREKAYSPKLMRILKDTSMGIEGYRWYYDGNVSDTLYLSMDDAKNGMVTYAFAYLDKINKIEID